MALAALWGMSLSARGMTLSAINDYSVQDNEANGSGDVVVQQGTNKIFSGDTAANGVVMAFYVFDATGNESLIHNAAAITFTARFNNNQGTPNPSDLLVLTSAQATNETVAHFAAPATMIAAGFTNGIANNAYTTPVDVASALQAMDFSVSKFIVFRLQMQSAPIANGTIDRSQWWTLENATTAQLEITAGDSTAPAPPRGVGAWAFDGEVSLGWADQFEPDLAGYNVYRATAHGGPYTKINGAPLTEPMYRDTGRTNGTPLYYVVRAVDSSNNESADSEEAPATPAVDVLGTRDGRVGLGKGFFLTPPHNNWNYVWPSSITANPDIAGFQMQYMWSELEPEQGRYDWSHIEFIVQQAEAAGKQWAFKFVTATGELKENQTYPPETVWTNDGTPAWFFNLPEVKPVGALASADGHLPFYPLFWDPAYLRHFDEFLAAMAKRYDGRPSLEYIRMGGWSCATNEPSFYSGATDDLTPQLQSYGMTGLDGSDNNDNFPNYTPYARGLRELQNLWFKNFKQTRMACTIHFPKSPNVHEEVMNENLVAHRGTLVNTGLNEADHSDTRTTYRDWHDNWGAKTGWGGITHLGDKGGPAPGKTLQETAVWQGLGSDVPGDEDFAPAGKSSYLVTGDDFADHPEATSWARDHFQE
ncbi:MAG: beta-galactosidase [Candidatus Sumerlaeota bacterium]|nr:beta-galactosidase [Candidatus Sumerlaeota bacterium]